MGKPPSRERAKERKKKHTAPTLPERDGSPHPRKVGCKYGNIGLNGGYFERPDQMGRGARERTAKTLAAETRVQNRCNPLFPFVTALYRLA